jgi:hypothetical protein
MAGGQGRWDRDEARGHIEEDVDPVNMEGELTERDRRRWPPSKNCAEPTSTSPLRCQEPAAAA